MASLSRFYSFFSLIGFKFLGRTAIAHSIREQVHTYQKSLFLVGHPADGSAVQDEDLKSSFLSPVLSVARLPDQAVAYTPTLNYLSDGELDRIDKEREKDAAHHQWGSIRCVQ